MFTNIRSIIPKRIELNSFIEDTEADLVVLTETWLHSNISDNEILSNQNFNLFRRDRIGRRGGGVLIATKNTLSSSLILQDDNIELLCILIQNPAVKAIFGVCYRPPDSHRSFCDSLTRALTDLKTKHPDTPVFLFGDFNFPEISWTLLSTSNRTTTNEANQFINLTLDFNLHQVISCPTRGNNTLDLLLTTCPDDIKSLNILPAISDHSLLDISIALPFAKKSPTTKLITDYKRGNYDAMNNELKRFYSSFCKTYETRTPNSNWELYKNELLNLKTKFIPSLLVKSDSNNPWFNNHLKRLRNRKKRLYRSAKSKNEPLAWDRYQSCATEYVKEIADAKDKFFSTDLLSILHTNPNKFWRLLSPKSKANHLQLTNTDGQPIDSDKCATFLNDYFTSVFNPASNAAITAQPCTPSSAQPDIQFSPIGIAKLIKTLKLTSSAGCDDINSKLLKNTILVSSEILCLIFDQSVRTGQVPDDWKKGKITPVFKSGNRSSPANYRPISLTCISSKLLEHIIASHVMNHLESINFFFPYQHGFRKFYSCETQLAEFAHDILVDMDDNLQTDAIFLDFAKAFDRVPHNQLLSKLTCLGLPTNIINWIQDFLTGRMQFTFANNNQSPLTAVTSGVPQGASLSPLLFLIYINDLPTNIKSKLRLFADDCVLYSAIKSPDDNSILQDDLNTIALWCNNWLMPLNLSKCKLISFSRKRSIIHHAYNINAVPICPVTSYKYLGVHMTPSLSWELHIDTICSEASRTLGYLRRNLKSAAIEIKKLAYLTFVRPKLEYASSIWHPSQAYLTTNLESIQNRAARFITSQYSPGTSITSLKQSISLPSLVSRRHIARLCLLHGAYYHPKSRHDLLKPPHRTSARLNHTQPIAHIPGRTSAFTSSFFPNAITLWNSLPDNIVSCTDRASFRKKLDDHYHHSEHQN